MLRSQHRYPVLALTTLTAAAALVAGCAIVPTASAPGAAGPEAAASGANRPLAAASAASSASAAAVGSVAAGASGGATGRAAAPTPGAPPAFAEVTKDAHNVPGYFTVWTKDEKTWLEIPADRLDQPFFFGNSLASGLGERFFWPGMTGPEHVVVLRRVGNTVQLVARNFHARAPEGTPLAKALAESYSDSLLAGVPLAAAPHPQRKSLLVDAYALLGSDIVGAQTQLEAAYRMPYALDRANSSIVRTRSDAQGTSVTVRMHFGVPKLPAPPVLIPGGPPPNFATLPNPPTVVPDPRSLFLAYTYTLAPLPAQPMKPRFADQRVGYFTQA